MSFIGEVEQGKVYAPGWFLAHEECVRETREFAQSGATTAANGGKYVKMGTFYPANDAGLVEGIVYEDVDVTTGNMPGSVVTKGVVYVDRLAEEPATNVLSALIAAKGFVFLEAPTVTRPDFSGDTEAESSEAIGEIVVPGASEVGGNTNT